MKFNKEIKVGLLAVICIALLFWGANFLKGSNILDSSKHLFAVYSQVDGLGNSNPVLVNGLKVGRVESIDFLPDNSGRIYIKFSITNKNINIPEDTKAKIVSADILGSKAISLVLGKSSAQAQNLDTLISDIDPSLSEVVNQQIAPLKRKAEGLINTIDSSIVLLSTIFNKKARTDLDSSFASIRGSLEAFERSMFQVENLVIEERLHLKSIFKNVESITGNLAANNEKLTQTLANVEAITDSLAGANLRSTIDNAAKVMEDMAVIVEKVNSGEGSLGALLNNDTLYTNLEAAAYDLDKLMLDMRLNPERYVHFSIFGRKSKETPE